MNPLDPLELQSFNERLLDIMPQQTETTLKIPKVMYGNFPKNMQEFSNQRFEKTLNKHQHTIEEIFHRDKNNYYSEWFKQYTRKYFIKSSVSHNSFFKNTILPDLSDVRQIGRQHNNPFISFPANFGSTLTCGSTVNTGGGGSGFIFTNKLSIGVTGQTYNEIAVNISVALGNIRMGCYDDNSTVPNNLLAETASVAAATGFPFNTVSQFALTTNQVYAALQLDNNSCDVFRNNSASGLRSKSFSYGAFQNPVTGLSSEGFGILNMKMAHS